MKHLLTFVMLFCLATVAQADCGSDCENCSCKYTNGFTCTEDNIKYGKCTCTCIKKKRDKGAATSQEAESCGVALSDEKSPAKAQK